LQQFGNLFGALVFGLGVPRLVVVALVFASHVAEMAFVWNLERFGDEVAN
jgi:hypothetical protein